MEHLIIQGGEQYLPFARSCVAKIKNLGRSYANQAYKVDGATIRVKITPGHEYIHIEGSEYPLYQFFTTGPNPLKREGKDLAAGYSVRVGFNKDTKKLFAKPTGSTVEPSLDDPPKWKFSHERIQTYNFLTFKGFQINGLSGHQFYPDAKGPKFVETGRLAANQTYDLTGSGMQNFGPYATDIGYDTAPAIFTKAGRPRGKNGVAPDTDWYRRGACQTAKSEEFGSRFLVMLTDTSGDLYVYPTSEIDTTLSVGSPHEAIKTSIPDRVTNKQKIPLPAWVRPYGAVPARETPTSIAWNSGLLWMFNSDGTKMVCIVPSDLPSATLNDVEYNPQLAGQKVRSPMLPQRTERPEAALGLLEFRIVITLTGPLPEEFTVALELITEVPPQGERCIIAADYYWGDLKDVHAPTGLEKDALITIDLELAHKRGAPVDGLEPIHSAIRSVANVRDFKSDRIIRSFVAHQADAPYCMNGAPFEDSSLRELHRLFGSMMSNVESRIDSWWRSTYNAIRTDIKDYKDAAVAEADELVAGNPTVTPALMAEFDAMADKHFKKMLEFAVSVNAGVASASYSAVLSGWVNNSRECMTVPKDAAKIVTSMLSYDLRALAFAVQAAVFKHDKNTVTRQDRIQIIVRNEVVHTVLPPDPEFQALVASFDDPQDMSGWTKLDQSAVINPSKSMFAYRQIRYSYDFIPGQQLRGRQDFDSDYPIGAAAYCLSTLMFMCGDMFESFCVHPAGHWSICIGPLIYYSGQSTQSPIGLRPRSEINNVPADPAKFVQNIVDIVSVQVIDKDQTYAVKGSHIELFNQAYGKSLGGEDFYLTVNVGEIERVPSAIAYGASIVAAGDPPTTIEFIHTYHGLQTLGALGLLDVSFSCPLSYLDTRSFLLGDISAPVFRQGSAIFLRYRRLEGASHVIRGSALFGGTTIRLP